jgi:hypothetical protein
MRLTPRSPRLNVKGANQAGLFIAGQSSITVTAGGRVGISEIPATEFLVFYNIKIIFKTISSFKLNTNTLTGSNCPYHKDFLLHRTHY